MLEDGYSIEEVETMSRGYYDTEDSIEEAENYEYNGYDEDTEEDYDDMEDEIDNSERV